MATPSQFDILSGLGRIIKAGSEVGEAIKAALGDLGFDDEDGFTRGSEEHVSYLEAEVERWQAEVSRLNREYSTRQYHSGGTCEQVQESLEAVQARCDEKDAIIAELRANPALLITDSDLMKLQSQEGSHDERDALISQQRLRIEELERSDQELRERHAANAGALLMLRQEVAEAHRVNEGYRKEVERQDAEIAGLRSSVESNYPSIHGVRSCAVAEGEIEGLHIQVHALQTEMQERITAWEQKYSESVQKLEGENAALTMRLDGMRTSSVPAAGQVRDTLASIATTLQTLVERIGPDA